MAWTRRLPSGRWQGTYRGHDGRRHTATWPTKTAARQWAEQAELDTRLHPDRQASSTVGEWWEQWSPTWIVEASTRSTAEGRWRKHLQPVWADVPLASVRTFGVQQWVARMLAGGVSAPTVRECAGLLSTVLGHATRAGLLDANPCRGVRLPPPQKRPDRFLTAAELDKVVSLLAQPYAAMAVVAAHTGLRWGELAGLHAERVDLPGRRLQVAETLTEVDGAVRVKPYPKSSSSWRSVPLDDPAVQVLAERVRARPSGLLFAGPDGGMLSRANTRQRHWQPALRSAGLVDPQPRWHDLRHTYASWLVQGGVGLAQVQRVMGHSTVTTTMRYAHLAPDTYGDVLAALRAVG